MGVSFDQLKQHRRVDDEKPRGSKLKHGKKKDQSMEVPGTISNILNCLYGVFQILCYS